MGVWNRASASAERDKVEMDLSTPEGTNELISYLVVRFVLVMLAVMLTESLVVWFEGRCLLPLLRGMASGLNASLPQNASSLGALLRWFGLLVGSIVQGNYLQTLGLARGSLIVLLTLLMLAMLVLAPLYGALMYARMVVRRVRALQERRERELAQIDQQRSQFMTDIAHDLRTPLMAISGMAHAIADDVVRDDAQRAEYLQSICDKTDKMSGLVSSVFEYAKLGSGSYTLERERIDLPQLLLREAAVAYEDIEAAGMHLSVEVPEDPCPVGTTSQAPRSRFCWCARRVWPMWSWPTRVCPSPTIQPRSSSPSREETQRACHRAAAASAYPSASASPTCTGMTSPSRSPTAALPRPSPCAAWWSGRHPAGFAGWVRRHSPKRATTPTDCDRSLPDRPGCRTLRLEE